QRAVTRGDLVARDRRCTRRARRAVVTQRAPRVAYLLTHYPRLSQTFVQREVEQLESIGFAVERVAINEPDAEDLLTAAAERESRRTFYVKGQSRARLAVTLVTEALRHPQAMASTLRLALRNAH